AQGTDIRAEDAQHVHPPRPGPGPCCAHAAVASSRAGERARRPWIPSRAGETNRISRPCAWQKRSAITLRKRSGETAREEPSSLAKEAMPTPGSPQATTHRNGSSSLFTLTAKPCVLTPRETCTPIEAILRCWTHTPV